MTTSVGFYRGEFNQQGPRERGDDFLAVACPTCLPTESISTKYLCGTHKQTTVFVAKVTGNVIKECNLPITTYPTEVLWLLRFWCGALASQI